MAGGGEARFTALMNELFQFRKSAIVQGTLESFRAARAQGQ